MSENKLKNFLVNGFQALDDKREEPTEEETVAASTESVETCSDSIGQTAETGEVDVEPKAPVIDSGDLREIRDELLRMRYILEDLRDAQPPTVEAPKVELPDMTPYLTSREQMKAVTASIEKRDADLSNKNLVRAMEQIAVMREDFFRLCQGMKERINELSAADVLSSFEAYEVDMENILSDGGVYIGPFDFDKLNTLHQRIIGVVPTDDMEKNGTIAERLTDGYKIGNKVLLKEKVKIYKFTEASKASETDSQTVCDKESGKDQEEEE